MSRIRILMADDHRPALERMRKLLDGEFDVVGTAEDGRAVLDSALELRPDVILMDISMPLLSGIDACRQLMEALPGTRVIFLTMHSEAVYVKECLSAGGSGYVLKSSAASELTQAIRTVMSGKTYVTPMVESKEPLPGNISK